jgi:hypothetical protein
MSITLELPDHRRIVWEKDTATIGRNADIVVSSPEVQPIHARLITIAGRWMVESAGDWLLQVNNGVCGRKHWLAAGDILYLTESGVGLIFDPQMPPETSSSTELDQSDMLPSLDEPQKARLDSPADEDEADVSPPPVPAEYAKQFKPDNSIPPCDAVHFDGRGTVMIGKGTDTFAGQRHLVDKQTKHGALMIPMEDVNSVRADGEHVDVVVKHGDGLLSISFDAANVEEASRIAAALERDDFAEILKKRSKESGHPPLIDHSPPKCFSVVFFSNS